MRKKLPPRVVGIYQDRSRFRLVICEDGKRRSLILESREEAEHKAKEIAATLQQPRPRLSVADALVEWSRERLLSGRYKPLTLREQEARLRSFLVDVLAQPMDAISAERAEQVSADAALRPCRKSGKPPAAASQRLYLKLCRALFAWAMARGYCRSNPFANIKPSLVSPPSKPLPQVEDARRFLDVAIAHFEQTAEALAIGAATALLLGLRTGEVLGCTVHDLQADGQVLCISRGRHSKDRQSLEVPTVLRPYLQSIVAGRSGDEPLFARRRPGGARTRQFLHTLVLRLCQKADVPPMCIDRLRGLFAQLGQRSAAVPHAVAASLGHGMWPARSIPAQSDHGAAAAMQRDEAPYSRSEPASVSSQSAALPASAGEASSLGKLSAEEIVAALAPETLHRLRVLLLATAVAPSAVVSREDSDADPARPAIAARPVERSYSSIPSNRKGTRLTVRP